MAPIVKNKLFFFTDWEYNPIGQAGTPSTGLLSDQLPAMRSWPALFPNNTNLQQLQKYLPASSGANFGGVLRAHHSGRTGSCKQ